MSDELSMHRARRLLAQGLESVAVGNLADAREKFRASASAFATADAVTYWAWMEHQLGNTEYATELCHRAIELDPDFGNPYNDIGSYLITQGKYDDAIPWLEKAVAAKRYEPRQFPHINLGRIYTQKQMPLRAIQEFRKALAFAPGDDSIRQMIEAVQITLN